MNVIRVLLVRVLLMPSLFLGFLLPAASADTLMVYSARSENLIKPLFDLYEAQTGHTVLYKKDTAKRLLRRLKAEGKYTSADLLITVDAGHLWFAANQGLLAPIDSDVLDQNIPSYLRDPNNRWFGLSLRARTIVYHSERVKQADLVSYEALADPKWQGRLCLRTSNKVYNRSLVAMLINRHGAKKTESFLKGWVDNLAVKPFLDDNAVMRAIEQGVCDLGIVNSYYFGRLQKVRPDLPLALFWPNAKNNGVHVNVSGIGVTQNAPHREAAVAFIEWMSAPQAQGMLAKLNMEYPVNPDVQPSKIVASWGSFDADNSNLSHAGRLQKYAARLMDRVGYK